MLIQSLAIMIFKVCFFLLLKPAETNNTHEGCAMLVALPSSRKVYLCVHSALPDQMSQIYCLYAESRHCWQTQKHNSGHSWSKMKQIYQNSSCVLPIFLLYNHPQLLMTIKINKQNYSTSVTVSIRYYGTINLISRYLYSFKRKL